MRVGTGAVLLVVIPLGVSYPGHAMFYVPLRGRPSSTPGGSAPAVLPPVVPVTTGVAIGVNGLAVPTREHNSAVYFGKSAPVVSVLTDYSLYFVRPVSTIGTRPTHPTGDGTTAARTDSQDDIGRVTMPGVSSTPGIAGVLCVYGPEATPVGGPRATVVDGSVAPAQYV